VEIDDTEAHRTGSGGGSNVLVLRGGGAPVEDPLVLSRVTGPVDPGPIDNLVRLGGGGRDASAVGLLFRLTPLYGSQFVLFKAHCQFICVNYFL